MTRFEPWTSDVGDSRSTTEPHHCPNCLVKRFRSSFEVLIRDDFLHADDKSGLFSFHPFFPPPMIDIEMFKTFFVGIEILVGQVKRRHVKNCQLTKGAYLPTMQAVNRYYIQFTSQQVLIQLSSKQMLNLGTQQMLLQVCSKSVLLQGIK